MVLVFRTNVFNCLQIKVIEKSLNENPKIQKWNFDLEDIDKILRVETNFSIGSEIIEAMKNFGFYCEELQ